MPTLDNETFDRSQVLFSELAVHSLESLATAVLLQVSPGGGWRDNYNSIIFVNDCVCYKQWVSTSAASGSTITLWRPKIKNKNSNPYHTVFEQRVTFQVQRLQRSKAPLHCTMTYANVLNMWQTVNNISKSSKEYPPSQEKRL